MTPLADPKRRLRFVPYNKDPVRLTALLYLREALLQEKYEECAEMIDIALEFGANNNEVNFLLEDPRRLPAGIARQQKG